jgi:hypothetical protein
MSIPEVFYREAIDVGRFSNSVANGFIENYVKVIHEAAEQRLLRSPKQVWTSGTRLQPSK